MPQFSVIPERARILEKIPDYEVAIEPLQSSATVRFGENILAKSSAAVLVKETRHADVVYFPREALNQSLFEANDHSTYCPFKGHANYWNLIVDNANETNIVWSYEAPYAEVEALKNYICFYADRTDLSFDD